MRWVCDDYADARDNARERRDRNRASGLCVNENLRGTHGKATRGVRCEHCYQQHKRSA